MRLPTLLCLSLLALPGLSQATPDVLRVASAHQPMPLLERLVDQYQLDTGNKVLLIEGNDTELGGEIAQGAAFDMFFPDDQASAAQLHANGRGEAPATYACDAQARRYLVLVEGPRHALAERFIVYLRQHPEALRQAGYALPGEGSCMR